jgi:GNAT superfamily N-acetyltransferase
MHFHLPRLTGRTRAQDRSSAAAIIACMSEASPDDDVVRPATDADATAVAEIWHEGWPDGHLGHVPPALVEVRSEESFHERAAARIADTTVAVAGGEVAGFVMVVDDEVEQVYVSRRHRGSGIAARLLTEGERQVRDSGHTCAWLAVVEGNVRARVFYERTGWVDDGPFVYTAHTEEGDMNVPCRRYIKRVG